MSDEIKYITPDEGDATPESELKELRATLQELEAGESDDLSKQAIESTKARIAELKQDNPSLQ